MLVKMNCATPHLCARRFSSTTHSSGVPINAIGDCSIISGVNPKIGAIDSAAFRVASRESEGIRFKIKLLALIAYRLRQRGSNDGPWPATGNEHQIHWKAR